MSEQRLTNVESSVVRIEDTIRENHQDTKQILDKLSEVVTSNAIFNDRQVHIENRLDKHAMEIDKLKSDISDKSESHTSSCQRRASDIVSTVDNKLQKDRQVGLGMFITAISMIGGAYAFVYSLSNNITVQLTDIEKKVIVNGVNIEHNFKKLQKAEDGE